MTHDEWERGERLTINNATKEQLKWMVKDRDEKIKKLLEENEKLNSTITGLTRFMSEHLPVKEEA